MEKNKRESEKKILIPCLAAVIFCLSLISCATYQYRVTPEMSGSHRMVRLKVYYKENSNKYSGKVIVVMQNKMRKIFILNPLGRVYFKLILKGEETMAVHVKKKKFWQGDFKRFINIFWGLGLNFDQFSKIVLSGQIPEKIQDDPSIQIKITHDAEKLPKTIEFEKDQVRLKIRILKNITREGKVDFHIDQTKLKEVNLNQLFEK